MPLSRCSSIFTDWDPFPAVGTDGEVDIHQKKNLYSDLTLLQSRPESDDCRRWFNEYHPELFELDFQLKTKTSGNAHFAGSTSPASTNHLRPRKGLVIPRMEEPLHAALADTVEVQSPSCGGDTRERQSRENESAPRGGENLDPNLNTKNVDEEVQQFGGVGSAMRRRGSERQQDMRSKLQDFQKKRGAFRGNVGLKRGLEPQANETTERNQCKPRVQNPDILPTRTAVGIKIPRDDLMAGLANSGSKPMRAHSATVRTTPATAATTVAKSTKGMKSTKGTSSTSVYATPRWPGVRGAPNPNPNPRYNTREGARPGTTSAEIGRAGVRMRGKVTEGGGETRAGAGDRRWARDTHAGGPRKRKLASSPVMDFPVDAGLLELIANHNQSASRGKHTFEPKRHREKDYRAWTRMTGKVYSELSVAKRQEANQEIDVMLRDGTLG
ncbi:unnamed protein product [Discosporangium mesarthrocarpum]